MGFRFRKSVKLFPGVRLSAGKRGLGLSVGPRGSSVSLTSRGTYGNLGIPGTGLSYRSKLSGSSRKRTQSKRTIAEAPPQILERNITFLLQDDGTIKFLDDKGNEVPRSWVDAAYRQQGDLIRQWLTEQCDKINKDFDSLPTIHLETPSPDTEIQYTPEQFDVEQPKPSRPKPISFFAKLFRSKRESIEKENAKAQNSYFNNLEAWNLEKAEFESDQAERRILIEEKRFNDPEAMHEFLTETLALIEWPYETSVSFQVENEGKIVYLDVDLPEIEHMPIKRASVAAKGNQLNIKQISETEGRRNYMTHVHGIGLRLIGEVFVALPTVDLILLSVYSQRINKATGNVGDEYLYSVKVTREEWSKINFSNLNNLDVVECLGSFEIRRKMTKTGVFTPIEPFAIGG